MKENTPDELDGDIPADERLQVTIIKFWIIPQYTNHKKIIFQSISVSNPA